MVNNYESRKRSISFKNINELKKTVRQRNSAHIPNHILGGINTILKCTAKKDLLTIKKINSRNNSFLITPAVIEGITKKGFYRMEIAERVLSSLKG